MTGASGKFGKVIIKELLKKGYGVIGITGREKSRLDLQKDHEGSECVFVSCDLTDSLSRESLFEELMTMKLNIYGLVNNARSISFLKTDSDGLISSDQFISEFNLGVVAAYDLSMKFSKLETFKRIINISSMYGVVATNPGLYEDVSHRPPLHYGVAKAALNHMTKELATRLVDDGVVVNSISYGGVEGRVNKNFLERYSNLCPSRKMLNESEVFKPVEFLLDEGTSSMVGHNLVVDGGWSIW